MESLSFTDWFKIVCTIIGFFIGYTKWFLSQQEKMKHEWQQEKKELISMLRNKTDKDIYSIQIEQIDKQLMSLESKMDKLTDMVQQLSIEVTAYKNNKEARH